MASTIAAITTGTGGVVTTADSSGNLSLLSGATTVVAVTATGVDVTGTLAATGASTFTGTGKFATTIGVGNATPSASGSGITFPATQSASSDANTLDDYEEGTFTVGVRGAGTVGTYTISSQTCSYTKIGRLVSLTIGVTGFSVASGGTSYMLITGLPFTNTIASKGSASVGSFDFSASTLFVVPAFSGSSGVSTLYFEEVKDAANAADFAIAGISTSSNFHLTITYSTS